jgi:hypothetical protein
VADGHLVDGSGFGQNLAAEVARREEGHLAQPARSTSMSWAGWGWWASPDRLGGLVLAADRGLPALGAAGTDRRPDGCAVPDATTAILVSSFLIPSWKDLGGLCCGPPDHVAAPPSDPGSAVTRGCLSPSLGLAR